MTKRTNIWRIYLIPHDKHIRRNEFGFCYQRNIIGIGWPIDEHPGNDKEKYLRLVSEKYGKDDGSWERSSTIICKVMSEGDIVWTRDHTPGGHIHLGEITDDWAYKGRDESKDPDAKNKYNDADIVSVRPCRIHEVCATDVGCGAGAFFETMKLNRFRRGTTIQRIAKDDLRKQTVEIWEKMQIRIQADKH